MPTKDHFRNMPLHPVLLISILALWVVTCIATFNFQSIAPVFEFAYFVLPLSSLVIPLIVGVLSVQARKRWGLLQEAPEPKPGILFLIAAAVIGVSAYGLCTEVLARFLELPWRAGKFGQTTLDLGLSAAGLYSLMAITVITAGVLLIRQAPANSRAAHYAAAGIGMVSFSSAIYLLIGLSPLVTWRA